MYDHGLRATTTLRKMLGLIHSGTSADTGEVSDL